MENEKTKRMKYVPPTIEAMKFEPGNFLASSTGVSSGGWSLDGGGTDASTGGWNIDDSNAGGSNVSTGGWSKDDGSTGTSTGSWSKD